MFGTTLTGISQASHSSLSIPCRHQVHPFQFRSGEYSDKLFDEEVKVCARAFMGDEVLKEKVKKAATEQFEALAEDPHRVMTKSCMVMHCGVTFRVECAKGRGAPPPAPAWTAGASMQST
jgi:hypothetical protein